MNVHVHVVTAVVFGQFYLVGVRRDLVEAMRIAGEAEHTCGRQLAWSTDLEADGIWTAAGERGGYVIERAEVR